MLYKFIKIAFVIVLLSAMAGCFFGDKVLVKNIINLNGALQNVSIGFFTLTGIWLAYIYPKALLSFVSGKGVSEIQSQEASKVQALVEVVIVSLVIVVYVLCFNLAYTLISGFEFSNETRIFLRSIALGITIAAFLFQLYISWVLFLLNARFVNELFIEKTVSKSKSKLLSSHIDKD